MKREFSGKVNVSGSLMVSKGSWQRINDQEKLKARAVLPGYPIEEPFKTHEDIEKYLSGDQIVCLLCGKDYKALKTHILVHNHTVESYKEKYKIPSWYGLIGKSTFNKLSAFSKGLHASGKISGSALGECVANRYKSGKKRTPSSYKSVKSIENDVQKRQRLDFFSKQRSQAKKERNQ